MKDLCAGQVVALTRSLPVCPDPVALFAERATACDAVLLESAEQHSKSGEKSLAMTRAAVRIVGRDRVVELTALSTNGKSVLAWLDNQLSGQHDGVLDGDTLRLSFPAIANGSEHERLTAPSPLDVVRAVLLRLERVGGEPSLAPLVAGSFSYDLLGVYEALPPAHDSLHDWPDFELWLAEELVWIQHRKRRSVLLRFVFGGVESERAYHDATAALGELVSLGTSVDPAAPASTKPIEARGGRASAPTDMSDDDFAALVTKLKEHIVAGDVFQIVPSRTFSLPCTNPLRAYRELRALNPSPYMFMLRSSHGTLFGASPESALMVKGAPKRVYISPIAGTRRRGRADDGRVDADLDTRIEAELRLDTKEVAEHMMLVDLARNDVARVSVAGTRSVDSLLDVVRYSHVMHLVSLVSGQLSPGLDALHAYVATMNMGTLVGAPKLRAAALLRGYEATKRGPYGGAVGYMSADGEMDTCIVIRSALVTDNIARVRAGAGVVYDSDPQAEADETRRKADAVLEALRRAEAP